MGLRTLLLTAGLCLSALAHGQDPRPVLRVGIYDNPPKVFLKASTPGGLFPELLNQMATANGWRLEYVPCDWRACLEMLHAGRLDLMPDVAYTFAHFRSRGLERALSELGLPLRPDHIAKVAPNDHDGAHAEARALLSLDPRPTAVIALTDQLAFAVLEVARELGLGVPGDVSVVGFDNVPMAVYANPPLTTFDQNIRESGRIAGDMVVARIELGEAGIRTLLLEPKLELRASHGPAPAD